MNKTPYDLCGWGRCLNDGNSFASNIASNRFIIHKKPFTQETP